MKNRQTNHHLEINVSDIYCLRGDGAGVLLAAFVLASGFESPPPPPTSHPLNITQDEKLTVKVLAVLPLCARTCLLARRGFLLLHGKGL